MDQYIGTDHKRMSHGHTPRDLPIYSFVTNAIPNLSIISFDCVDVFSVFKDKSSTVRPVFKEQKKLLFALNLQEEQIKRGHYSHAVFDFTSCTVYGYLQIMLYCIHESCTFFKISTRQVLNAY